MKPKGSSSRSGPAGRMPAVVDDDFTGAIARFPLEPWLARHGFDPQGRSKKEWVNDCWLCGAEEKFSVNPKERFWRCFVCQKQLELIDVIAHFEGSYAVAIQIVRMSAGGRSLAVIPAQWETTATAQRSPTWEPLPIEPPPSFRPLTDHNDYTRKRGFDLNNLLALGAGVCTRGRYADRLVFPVRRWWDGSWIYFQSRAMWEKSEQPPDDDGKVRYRKNLNPDYATPEDQERYASASDVLMGLELLNGARTVGVVEGPTDLVQSLPACVALLGKNLSPRQLMLLVQAGVERVVLALDPDAWQKPTRKTADGRLIVLEGRLPPGVKVAQELAPHFHVDVARYPVGFDPGNYSPADNAAWRAAAQRWGDGDRLRFIP